MAEKIKVAIRVRPANEQEKGLGQAVEVIDDTNLVFGNEGDGQRRNFTFDNVFGPAAGNNIVFENTARGCVDNVVQGNNASAFVYGASGSGKTYTMRGTSTNPGLIDRTIQEMYTRVSKTKLSNLPPTNDGPRAISGPREASIRPAETSPTNKCHSF